MLEIIINVIGFGMNRRDRMRFIFGEGELKVEIHSLMLVVLLTCLTLPSIADARAPAEERTRLYRDNDLKVAFQLPPRWEQRKCRGSAPNKKCVALRPHDRRKAADPAIRIEVEQAGLEKSLGEDVLFEKRGAGWVKHGRFGESDAVAISGVNWRGFEATASCGISDEETGFHAGAGQCYTAIVSNGGMTAVIETDGFESTLDVAALIRKSFRFIK